MFKPRTIRTLAAVMLVVPTLALAKDDEKAAPPKPALPSMGELLDAWGISASGHLDVAYSYASRNPADRQFDTSKNSFNLHQAAITLAKQPKEGVGALVNVTAGDDADILNAASGHSPHSVDLTQALIHYGAGPLTLSAGKFVTLAGTEVIASPGNANYSRSLLFFAAPLTHTGVRGVYAVNDGTSVTVGLNNGWNIVRDDNAQKTLELGANLSLTKEFTLALSNYYGAENTFGGTNHGASNIFDIVGTYALSDTLSMGAEYLNFRQKNFALINGGSGTATYQGLAGYVSMMLSDAMKLSARAEWLDDSDGVLSGQDNNSIKELTLTLGYAISKNAEVRAEIRGDRASKDMFADSKGVLGKTLTTFGVQAILKF